MIDKEAFRIEIWEDIKGYEGLYQVSNLGRIKSLSKKTRLGKHYGVRKERILKLNINSAGYYTIWLWKNGKRRSFQVHRLVAVAFIKNPNNYLIINHKDENKTNNNVKNLEWCTNKYNVSYGTCRRRAAEKTSKPVYQYTLKGKFIKRYNSTMDAKRQTDIPSSNICNCCNGKLKTAGGYKWLYNKIND